MHLDEFDLEITSHPIKIKRKKEPGQTEPVYDFYTIHTMTGEEKGAWQNMHNKRHLSTSTEYAKGKQSIQMRLSNFVGMEATLLSFCMRGPHPKTVIGELMDESGPLVDFTAMCAWPGPVLAGLGKIARTVNALNEEGVEEAKDNAKND